MMFVAYQNLEIFGGVCVAVWFLVIRIWPRIFLSIFRRAILVKGGPDGPIPINTLYTEPAALFADPLHPPAGTSKLWTTGVNHDTLLTVGWLDLSRGPQVLHVPDMAGRYYRVQFNDPSENTNFACVGKRTTGTGAGEYMVSGPAWQGTAPKEMPRILSPNNSVLVVGRTLVENDEDLAASYRLAKHIQIAPLATRDASR